MSPAALDDVIAIFSVLRDPARYGKALDDLKARTEAAAQAQETARRAQADASAAKDEIAAQRAALDSASAAHAVREKQLNDHDGYLRGESRRITDWDKTVTAREDKAAALEATNAASAADLRKREQAVAEREEKLREGEARCAAVLADLGPLASKLGAVK